MSVFEIEGVASRMAECDMAEITITFRAEKGKACELSRRVMDECDDFLEEIRKTEIDLKSIHLAGDSVEEPGFSRGTALIAERKIMMQIPYDLKSINFIQSLLQKGKYEYEITVRGVISNRRAIRLELAKEALSHSREEAEQLADVLGIKVQGVESIRRDRWDEDEEIEIVRYKKCVGDCPPRASDELGRELVEECVNLKVKWIMAES